MVTQNTVLVVDDDPAISKLFGTCIGAESRILSARNAAETFAMLESHPIDIIFLDIILPDAEGISVCKRLRQLYALKALQIILVSA